MDFIFQWLDVVWLALGLILARADQRWLVAGFFLGCMMMMRLQVELMESTGFNFGFIGLMDLSVLARGLAVYSLFYVLFLIWMLFSPYAKGTILMAGAISVFFMAGTSAMVIMCL